MNEDLMLLLGISGDPDITPEYQRAHSEGTLEAWRDYAIFLENVIINGVAEINTRQGFH